MRSNERREKIATALLFGVYILGWGLVGTWPELAALLFLGILMPAYWSVPRESPNRTSLLKQTMLFAAALSAGGLWMSVIKFRELDESRRFGAYLSEHRCKLTGQLVTGFAAGGCDRFENCTDGSEITEQEYLCGATGKRITFSQFRRGQYGY